MSTPFSSSIVKIKTKLLPRWPAAVNATAPIVSTKANGAVTLTYDSSTLPLSGSLSGTAKVLFRDGSVYQEILASGLASGTIANNRIMGNVSGGTAAPSALTAAQVAAILPVLTGDAGSGGAYGFAPTPAAGDAAAGKYLAASGAWTAPTTTGANVSFAQPGTGASTRTAQAKMQECVSVTDFGADPTYTNDSTTAFNNFFTYITASDKAGYIPAGNYKLSSQIVVSGGSVKLYGDGQRISNLIWTSAAASRGLSFTLATDLGFSQTVTMSDLSLLTYGGSSGKAIYIKDTHAADRVTVRLSLTNVTVRGYTNPTTDGWFTGIHLDGVPNAYIANFCFIGRVNGTEPNYSSGQGILIDNASAASPHGAGYVILAPWIYYAANGIYVEDFEGAMIQNGTIFGVNNGVTFKQPAGVPYAHAILANSHINASSACVILNQVYEAFITENLLYSELNTATATHISVVTNAGWFQIKNNTFENLNQTYAANSIVVTSGEYGSITGNTFRRCNDANTGATTGTAIWLTAGATFCQIGTDNLYGGASLVGTQILNSGANNKAPNTALAVPGTTTTEQGLITKWGSNTVTLDGSGNGTVTFGTAFPTGYLAAVVNNGDPTASGALAFVVNNGSCSASTLAFSVRASPGAVNVRVNWIAYGY